MHISRGPGADSVKAAMLLAACAACSVPYAAHATASHDLDKLQWYALDLVNTERALRGLDRLQMSGTESAQIRAEDAIAQGRPSGFDSDGYGPQECYGLAGGTGTVLENVGWMSDRDNPGGKMARIMESWMGGDAQDGWAHMDAILDPRLTHANFGIAVDGRDMAFVQHLESIELSWDGSGTYGGWFYLHGPQQHRMAEMRLEAARMPEPSRIAVGADPPGVRWETVREALPYEGWGWVPDEGLFFEWRDGDGNAAVWHKLPELDPQKIHRVTVWDEAGFSSAHVLERRY